MYTLIGAQSWASAWQRTKTVWFDIARLNLVADVELNHIVFLPIGGSVVRDIDFDRLECELLGGVDTDRLRAIRVVEGKDGKDSLVRHSKVPLR